uniref:Uncharacterized protein n=1 Tax=Cacopsylla melanoneura TaxID=428564 RepID=A0A8D8W0D4_9HEMI
MSETGERKRDYFLNKKLNVNNCCWGENVIVKRDYFTRNEGQIQRKRWDIFVGGKRSSVKLATFYNKARVLVNPASVIGMNNFEHSGAITRPNKMKMKIYYILLKAKALFICTFL